MPALNFMQRLALMVESGVKRHTVRRTAKRPIKPGDRLVLFTGMRTKHCRRLMDTECTKIQQIALCSNGLFILDGRALSDRDADKFCQADGLTSRRELWDFVERQYGLPFDGVVIHWRYNKA